jgi:hypothetical protein
MHCTPATAQSKPLLTFCGTPQHDWHQTRHMAAKAAAKKPAAAVKAAPAKGDKPKVRSPFQKLRERHKKQATLSVLGPRERALAQQLLPDPPAPQGQDAAADPPAPPGAVLPLASQVLPLARMCRSDRSHSRAASLQEGSSDRPRALLLPRIAGA